MSRSPGAIHNIIRIKAARYINSKPGPNNAGYNTNCHPGFHRLIEGAQLDFKKLYKLDEILDFSLGQMELAESFCSALELGIPENRQLHQFDYVQWKDSLRSQIRERHKRITEASKVAANLLEKYESIRSCLL